MVRLSGCRVGINKFSNYFVLGDDLVIFNEKVAKEYISICQFLGISTKDTESIHPKKNHSLEVAKRLFRKGVEVSPLPFRLMKTNFGLFSLVCMDRGHSHRLVTLYPGNRRKTISLTAAALLTMWKILPPWRTSLDLSTEALPPKTVTESLTIDSLKNPDGF